MIHRYRSCTTAGTGAHAHHWCAINIIPGADIDDNSGKWAWCAKSVTPSNPWDQHPGRPSSPFRRSTTDIEERRGNRGPGSYWSTKQIAYRRCKIPFHYNHRTYYQCTRDGHNKPWCFFESKKGAWGEC